MKKPLYSLLGILPGITAFVGAGGKTSAIFAVCRELRQRGFSVAVTTTTHMFPPPEEAFGPAPAFPFKGRCVPGSRAGNLCRRRKG